MNLIVKYKKISKFNISNFLWISKSRFLNYLKIIKFIKSLFIFIYLIQNILKDIYLFDDFLIYQESKFFR